VQLAVSHDTAPDRRSHTPELRFVPRGNPVATLRLYIRKRWLGSDTVKLIDGQTSAARAYGQVALDLRALPRSATICATLQVLRLSVVDNSAPRVRPLDNPSSLPYPSQELPGFLTACREVAHDDQFGLVCVGAGGMSALAGLGLAAPPAPRAAPVSRHGPCPAAPQTAYSRRLPGLPSAGDRPCGNGPAVRIGDTLARAEKPPGGTQTD
jgi:hypothetical protein